MSAIPPTRNLYRILDQIDKKLDIIVKRIFVMLALRKAQRKLDLVIRRKKG